MIMSRIIIILLGFILLTSNSFSQANYTIFVQDSIVAKFPETYEKAKPIFSAIEFKAFDPLLVEEFIYEVIKQKDLETFKTILPIYIRNFGFKFDKNLPLLNLLKENTSFKNFSDSIALDFPSVADTKIGVKLQISCV